jgi:putative hydrolase of the HAD superfamily
MPFIDAYDAILLDMNRTFMFGEDRFSEDENYYPAYVEAGGTALTNEEVSSLINGCVKRMWTRYNAPAFFDDFPSVAESLRDGSPRMKLDSAEWARLERVFQMHELGRVPEEYVACLKRLAGSHRIGVVSNIWARKSAWVDYFREIGIHELFEALIFSSDGPHMKPSPVLFRTALDAMGIQARRTLYVGDSLLHDVHGSKALGMDAVLIDGSCSAADELASSLPDLRLKTLLDLPDAPTG